MDNATRKELLYKARAAGYPGSILDVFAGHEQGKDVVAEFQQQQQMQQMQQQQMPAQQSMQMQAPQMPTIPSSPTPAPNFSPPQPPAPVGIQSQDTQMGIVSNQSGPNQGRAIFKTGGFKYEEGGPRKDFDLSKSVAENIELNKRARIAGWNSVEEYEKAGWGYNTVKQKQQALLNNPEAQKFAVPVENKDQLYANKTSGAQKAVNQAYNVLSNPIESAGHAMKYGYVPQGNLGNYGLREDGDAVSMTVNDFVNPFAWGNAAYRFSKDVTNKDSYTTGMGALNMGADLAESLPFFGAAAKTMAPGVKAFASHPLVNGLHDVAADRKLYGPVYAQALASKAANSLTSPFGIPLYKLPGINKAYKNAAYAVGSQSGSSFRSIKQVKDAIFKGSKGEYTGNDFGQPDQNLLQQYIYGNAANFEPSSVPQRGLTKYSEKYGPLDNFKLKMTTPEDEAIDFFTIAPRHNLGDKWANLNPELSHLDKMPRNTPEEILQVQKSLERAIQKKGILPISRKGPGGGSNGAYTDTDIAGHTMFLIHDPATGKISSHIQDIWKFTPDEYAKKWGVSKATQNLTQYRTYQQAKLMEKAGKPFVLHGVRPFELSPQFQGKPMGTPEILHLAEEADPNAGGFKSKFINLNKSKKLGGAKCYTCVGRKRRV
jgi:hypothetical protein